MFCLCKDTQAEAPSTVHRVGRQVSVQVVSQDGPEDAGEGEEEKQEEESHIGNTRQCPKWMSLSKLT